MASKKKEHDAARARAAKEKKILAALVVPLAGAGFFAYHTLSKLHHPEATLSPAAVTVAAVSAVQGQAAPASTTPVVPVSNTGLSSLSHLASKDPFHDQGPHSSGGGSKPTLADKNAKPKQKQKQQKQPQVKPPPLPPPTMAVISVNGTLTAVAVGTNFGTAPGYSGVSLFRLVALQQKKAEIRVVGSSSQQRWLVRGKPLRLTFSGWTYTLLLRTAGWATAQSTATATATTPTTTTPVPGG